MVNKLFYATLACGLLVSVTSCENQKFNDTAVDVNRVHVDTLSTEMQKVRDYVPEYAVVAHRGSTFWTPEETEASYRWAREMGADYLECDMQVSKDGVILALHDTDLKRTTNIEAVFGEYLPEKLRREYYTALGYSQIKTDSLISIDKKNFVPNYPSQYTYYELMHLDAGKWFNESSLEVARTGFETHHQYISTLEDLIMYSKGYRLKRYGADEPVAANHFLWGAQATGERVVTGMVKTDKIITNPVNFVTKDVVVNYVCEYVRDEHWSGNIPGIYIEFKEPWLNPSGFEQMVYNDLTMKNTGFPQFNMNIIDGAVAENIPFFIDRTVAGDRVDAKNLYGDNNNVINTGNTRGKVILQTFSLQSLVQVSKIFKGEVPMCFLLWKGTGATDLTYDDPQGYASFINLGVEYKAHYIGPCIAGAPNDYPELNQPWQHYLIHQAKMKNHPYSFDTYDQMAKYFGQYNFDIEGVTRYQPPYADAFFTNHTDMSLDYLFTFGYRDKNKAQFPVPNPNQVLDELKYEK